MKPPLLVATVAAVTAIVALAVGSEAQATPEGGPRLTADALLTVTVRAGGGQVDPGPSPALPELDRFAPQRASRGRAAPPKGADSARPTPRDTIDIGQRAALRRAGWTVPAKLAGSWLLRDVRVFSESDDEGGMLQLVYTRGGARVSVFQRAAPVDWSGVPADGASVPELAGSVREWPDAEPARLVWQTQDRTFVLVGDLERAELLRVAKSLPEAETESVWHRLRRGLSELLARLSP